MQLLHTRRSRVMSVGGALGLLIVLIISLAVARPATRWQLHRRTPREYLALSLPSMEGQAGARK